MADAPPVHHVMWTSGWDSTYRVADLVLVHGRTVQPWYVVDPDRRTAHTELDHIRRIRARLAAIDPSTVNRLRPTAVRRVSDIRPDPAFAAATQRVGAREPLTPQQQFLPLLVRQEGVGRMELCSTADDHMADAFATSRVRRNSAPAPDDWWFLDAAGDDADALAVWGGYALPVLHVTKLEMAEAAGRAGFADVMELTWFCRWPTAFGHACGQCVPCQVTWEAGLRRRLPVLTPTRIVLHSVKWDLVRRGAVARADLDSVVRAARSRLGG